jgi:hypothetical protein
MLSKTESGPRHCSVRLVPLLWLITLCFCFADLNPRQSCGQGYHLCSPAGASFRDIPEVGPGLAKLYLNLIATINPQPAPARVFGRSRIADGGLTTDGLDSAGLFCFAKGEQDDALTTYCSDNGYWCSDLEGGAFSDAVYYTDDNISACDKNCECAQRLREQPAQSKVARGVSFPTRRVRETPVNLCCKSSVRCGNMQGKLTQHRRRYHGLYAFAQLRCSFVLGNPLQSSYFCLLADCLVRTNSPPTITSQMAPMARSYLETILPRTVVKPTWSQGTIAWPMGRWGISTKGTPSMSRIPPACRSQHHGPAVELALPYQQVKLDLKHSPTRLECLRCSVSQSHLRPALLAL